MDDEHDYFSQDYTSARQRFRAAALANGYTLGTIKHTLPGPKGEELTTDLAFMGDPEASKLIITTSGIHGVEGYAGSACQLQAITEKTLEPLPEDTAILHVHALNPYGFAHNRRVNEDNIDVNRNFVDWSQPVPPPHSLTAKINKLILPEKWSTWPVTGWKEHFKFAFFALWHKPREMQKALQGGQYAYPDGLFYGGNGPCWSNMTWRDIVKNHVHGREQVIHIDFHTGLGKSGALELIMSQPEDSASVQKARNMWGNDVKPHDDESSVSVELSGYMESVFSDKDCPEDIVSVTAEFGTVPAKQVFNALVLDNWVAVKGQRSGKLGQKATRMIKEAFNPDNEQWRQEVLGKSRYILRRALMSFSRP